MDKVFSNLYELQLNLEDSLCFLAEKFSSHSKKISYPNHEKRYDKSKQLTDTAIENDPSVKRSLKVFDLGDKKLSTSEGKPLKKIKLANEKSQKSSISARAKGIRIQPAKSQASAFPEKSSDIPKVQKNDSNRFWSLLDSYCVDITSEDVKVLEKWIESHETDAEYQNTPELGVHYSSKWMDDEILEEKKEGTKSMENPKGIDFTSGENDSEQDFIRKLQTNICSSDFETPPLVEKLISSLVQENIITSPNDIMAESIPDDNFDGKKKEDKSLYSYSSLEKRLMSQFVDLGILEKESEPTADDEVLQELTRLQNLLIPVTELNLQKKKALLSRVKVEIAKQEAQKRIQETDAKVMESYRIMSAARSKGKKLGKKELSQIRSMLEERNAFIRHTRIDC